MLDEVLSEASRICANIQSFSEELDALRQKRNLTQKQLSKCLCRSEAEVSRLLNHQIPKKLTVSDVHQMAKYLDCTRVELVRLVDAFLCHRLTHYEMIDLDKF